MGRRIKYNCIYVLLGPNRTAYIGQTSDPINRKSRYKTLTCKNQRLVYESLLKFGFAQHQFKVVIKLKNEATREEMDFYEKYYFSIYKECGYSMLNLKSPGWNGTHNHESIKRSIQSLKGKIPWNKGKKGCQEAWNKGLKKSDYVNR